MRLCKIAWIKIAFKRGWAIQP